jgi:hypothetical protein
LDSDGDGLTDYDEVNLYYTNPNDEDSDGDGLSDGDEVQTYDSDPSAYEVWVDFGYVGTESGTPTEPYNSIPEANTACPSGGTLRMNGGSSTTNTDWKGQLDIRRYLIVYDGTVTIGE